MPSSRRLRFELGRADPGQYTVAHRIQRPPTRTKRRGPLCASLPREGPKGPALRGFGAAATSLKCFLGLACCTLPKKDCLGSTALNGGLPFTMYEGDLRKSGGLHVVSQGAGNMVGKLKRKKEEDWYRILACTGYEYRLPEYILPTKQHHTNGSDDTANCRVGTRTRDRYPLIQLRTAYSKTPRCRPDEVMTFSTRGNVPHRLLGNYGKLDVTNASCNTRRGVPPPLPNLRGGAQVSEEVNLELDDSLEVY